MSGGHRGPAPEDRQSFAQACWAALRTAVDELSWLLERGYAERSALELVGNRHGLTARQRKAVSRCAASAAAVEARLARRVEVVALTGEVVHVDGFNAIIVGESVLGGGVVLRGRDGAHRDLASVHGTYARVEQTGEVIAALGELLRPAREVRWLLDRPVSNSGRLAGMLREWAEAEGLPWEVELCWDPDRVLVDSEAVVASGDARILDAGVRWVDLPGALAQGRSGRAWVIDLG
ncbi:DUF434 domain-containing protein [Paraliomyxa miuraensis]|uniref:DUF434 domain-containing protein n=1 Tax=Paraliomyxa miuraensis TaxID=376150 RepID=UPI002250F475|nr:DUF434 domain-containing protein [Paraliomyxa miuraensis]MCX4243874.1 DUF434 domain-containing protein [Paraliomyxa miuraensis]